MSPVSATTGAFQGDLIAHTSGNPDTRAFCEWCAYADVHHGWPTDKKGTHCRDCHKSWTGLVQAHCTVCHETFASQLTADKHWSGIDYDAEHLDPGTVIAGDGSPKLVLDAKGMWHRPGTRPSDFAGKCSEALEETPGAMGLPSTQPRSETDSVEFDGVCPHGDASAGFVLVGS